VENTALKKAVEGLIKKEEGVEEEKGDRRSLVEKMRSKGEDDGERRKMAEKVRSKDEEEGEIRREIQCQSQSQSQSRTETPTRSGRPPKRLGQGTDRPLLLYTSSRTSSPLTPTLRKRSGPAVRGHADCII
jgi:hypothetical protein